jgi:hypothetical protein
VIDDIAFRRPPYFLGLPAQRRDHVFAAGTAHYGGGEGSCRVRASTQLSPGLFLCGYFSLSCCKRR